MAPITKPLNSTAKAVEEARHFSVPVVAAGVVIAILYYGRSLFITSIVAVTIAFILDPFVLLLMRVRLPRSVASFVVCATALLFLYVMGMGAYAQLSGLYDDLPKYGQRIGDIVDTARLRVQSVEDNAYRMVLPARLRQLEERQREEAAARKKSGKRGETAAVASPGPTAPEPARPPGTPIVAGAAPAASGWGAEGYSERRRPNRQAFDCRSSLNAKNIFRSSVRTPWECLDWFRSTCMAPCP